MLVFHNVAQTWVLDDISLKAVDSRQNKNRVADDPLPEGVF